MTAGAHPVRSVCLAVEGFYQMGGTERQVVELAVELRRRGLPVTVLSRWPMSADNAYAQELLQAGVRLRVSGWRGTRAGQLRRLPYLRAKLRAGWREPQRVEAELWQWERGKVQAMWGPGFVLHEVPFFGMLSEPGRRMLTALDIPLVISVLGGVFAPIIDIPDVVVTADGAPVIKPAGTSYTWVPSIGHRAAGAVPLDAGRPRSGTVLYGGRLVPEKDVDCLLEAMTRLPEMELVIAGDGVERPRLQRLAGALGVRARFVGAVQPGRLFELMRQADVAAFPGLLDGLPSFVVEALGTGLPVVATAVGGIPRALEEGGGLLVPPGDPEAMADGIRRLAEGDLAMHRRLARRAYEARFTPPRVADRYLDCYAEAMDRWRARRQRVSGRAAVG